MRLTAPELVENLASRKWRLTNLYKITNKEKETVTFKPNFAQSLILDDSPQYWEALKARQLGISTLALVDCLDQTIWSVNQTVCILAHEQDAIKKLFRIVRFAYDNLDARIKPQLGKGGGSQYELYFPKINSRIYVDLESRGDTISRLHVSEFAFIINPDKVRATMDAVPIKTGRISIESTPNGMNHFYEFWNDPGSTFQKYFFPWFFDPEYAIDPGEELIRTEEEQRLTRRAKRRYNIDLTDAQINFRRFKIAQKKSYSHFIQEYPEDEETCFIASGDPVLDRAEISEHYKKVAPPLFEKDGLEIFEDFQEGNVYVIGADVAEGVGGDFSVGTVYNVTKRVQVAQIRGQWSPSVFAGKLHELGFMYSNERSFPPLMGVERNNHGHAVLLKLDEILHYPNLYKPADGRNGWVTNSVTRPLMMDNFVEVVNDQSIGVRSRATLAECLTLVNNSGKIEAATGKHDDTIVASAIAIQLFKEASYFRGLFTL